MHTRSRLGGRLLGLVDVDATAFAVKADLASDQRKQRIVLAAGDVAAGVIARAALPYQDAARRHGFAAEGLDAQPLAVRFATIPDRSLSFFMRHGYLIIGGLSSGFVPPLGLSLGISRDEAR